MRRLLCVIALAALAGCATPTPYQARDGGPYGFAEQTIEADRVALTFKGNSLTERDTVENYLLFRAAEITLERGFDHFITTSRATDPNTRLTPSLSSSRSFGFSPFYSYYHPRFGWRPWFDPFWSDPVEYRQITQYEAAAEIQMRRGPKPADNPAAYDARQVVANLGPLVRRPSQEANPGAPAR